MPLESCLQFKNLKTFLVLIVSRQCAIKISKYLQFDFIAIENSNILDIQLDKKAQVIVNQKR